MAEPSFEHSARMFGLSERAKGSRQQYSLSEVLNLTVIHLTNTELYNILTVNKQWFSTVVQCLWRAVHFIDFMKITERGRERAASSSRRRTWNSSWNEEEDGEDHLNRNGPTKSRKHQVSSEDARRLAIYSSNIVTFRLDDPEHYFASSYKVIREFSCMIDDWCETICELVSTDLSFWPTGVKAPPRGSRTTKSQISTADMFPKLSSISWRYETHWERMDFDVPLNPVHGLLQLPLVRGLHLYERIEYAARHSSKICFTNAVARGGCGEMATERLLTNLRGNSNLRNLELCCSRHSRLVHSGRWIASARHMERRARRTSEEGSGEDGSDGDEYDEGDLTEEGWESNLERLILRSNYPQHLLLLLVYPLFLGPLNKLRYLHLHSTLKNTPPKATDGSSSYPDKDESDEEDPTLSLNWVTHPRYGAGHYGSNTLSRQREAIAPFRSLFEGVVWERVGSPPPPPPPPKAVVHIDLPLFHFIAAFFPQLEMLVLEGLWNMESLMRLDNIPDTLHPPHEVAADCSSVFLHIPVDFKGVDEVQDRVEDLILGVEQALKQRGVVESSAGAGSDV